MLRCVSRSLLRAASPGCVRTPFLAGLSRRHGFHLRAPTLPLEVRGLCSPANPIGNKVPITLLSGFLGSGKTTLLQELLTNKGGMRVGVVVNDVASVNIDAKLVRDRSSSGIRTKSGEGMEFVELENGCACCNASDELMVCIVQLLEMSAAGGYKFDRIVIEMSGVAEPKNVRREFQEAMSEGHPVFDAATLASMITVVDSPHFFDLFSSKHDVADHAELLGVDEQQLARDDAYDVMKSVEVERKVVDLLVEQIECSSTVVLNKIDRVSDERRAPLRGMIAALNAGAELFECSFGKVPLAKVFGGSEVGPSPAAHPLGVPAWRSKALSCPF
jgi:G3E family GTPase